MPKSKSLNWLNQNLFFQGNEKGSDFKRLQQEILNSVLFDKLKTQIGMRDFVRLQDKIKTIPIDFVSIILVKSHLITKLDAKKSRDNRGAEIRSMLKS